MRRFYHSKRLTLNEIFNLEDFVVHHLIQVLRAKEGDKLILFNGDGNDYEAEIKVIKKRSAQVLIISKNKNFNESHINIHLYQALTSNEKMDWIIQKATELGVQNITPISTKRNQNKIKEDKKHKKNKHWQQIIISACEQSRRAFIPKIHPIISLDNLSRNFNQNQINELRLVLSPNSQNKLKNNKKKLSNLSIMIGPEGGFTDNELEIANSMGFQSISIGPRILRTETASIASIAILQQIYGDFV